MRPIWNLVVLVCLASGQLMGQSSNFDEWKIYGGYQLTHLDTHAAQDVFNLNHVLDPSFPALHFGNYQNLNGWNFGLEEDTFASWFGVIVDSAGGFATNRIDLGSSSGLTDTLRTRLRLYTLVAGPQFTLRRSPNFQPFARVLLGGGWGSFSSNILENHVPQFAEVKLRDSGFAFGGGIGSDFYFSKRFGMRVAVDYIRTPFFEEKQSNIRGSAGIVFRH
jgi:hypothetical protein